MTKKIMLKNIGYFFFFLFIEIKKEIHETKCTSNFLKIQSQMFNSVSYEKKKLFIEKIVRGF